MTHSEPRTNQTLTMANLPKSVINTIKATAPVVGAKSTEITGCFYPKLFKNNPETLNYFNKSNQGYYMCTTLWILVVSLLCRANHFH